jgi:hypothetical protein
MASSMIAPPERTWRAPVAWWVASVLAAFVAAYSLRYPVLGERAYVPGLAASLRERPWLIWAHALFGPVALLSGLTNLLPALRHPPRWVAHRWVGRAYVASALLTGVAGVALSAFAAGGTVARSGFGVAIRDGWRPRFRLAPGFPIDRPR